MIQLASLDWLVLLHPLFAILFIYPVAGTVVRLGLLARERRTGHNLQLPPTVSTEHWQHGRWLTGAVLLAALVGSGVDLYVIHEHPPELPAWELLSIALGSLAALAGLWLVRSTQQRLTWALLCWAGLLAVAAQHGHLAAAPWRSHTWLGVLLAALLLLNLAIRAEISRSQLIRRLHLAANLLVTLLLAMVAITGSRDLLVLPLRG
jgi:hypothetical protein